jgi:hypothetical protein
MLSEINRKLGNLQTGLPITGGSYYTPMFRIGQRIADFAAAGTPF